MTIELPVDNPDSNGHQVQVEPPTRKGPSPVPRLQILAITLIQVSEPITATVIYPFINQFVRNTGITQGDERKTGYYAGMIVSQLYSSLVGSY